MDGHLSPQPVNLLIREIGITSTDVFFPFPYGEHWAASWPTSDPGFDYNPIPLKPFEKELTQLISRFHPPDE